MKESLTGYWKVWGLVAVILIALASSGYAYWKINSPSSTLYVTATKPPLELRMELDKTEFQLNETVAIHLSLMNIGDKTIKMFVPYLEHWVGFIVKDVNNTVVLDYPYGGIASVDEATLEPSGQIDRTLYWSQIRYYPHESGGVYLDSVPPGTYYIVGRTGEYLTYGLEEAEDWAPQIETPSITIAIG